MDCAAHEVQKEEIEAPRTMQSFLIQIIKSLWDSYKLTQYVQCTSKLLLHYVR